MQVHYNILQLHNLDNMYIQHFSYLMLMQLCLSLFISVLQFWLLKVVFNSPFVWNAFIVAVVCVRDFS